MPGTDTGTGPGRSDAERGSGAERELFCLACWRPVPEWAPGGPSGRPRARCPRCGALERHRFLAFVLEQLGLAIGSAAAVLDIAPQRQVQHILKRLAPDAYVAVDLFADLRVDLRADITRLPFDDGAFDVILCYHVLEHIPDDRAAMRELARILSPGGFALVQVPWRRSQPTDEDPSAPPAERVRRFGQDDHVRWYGVDFEERLAAAGLAAYRFEPRDLLDDDDLHHLAIKPQEAVWLCRRARDGRVVDRPALGALRRVQPYAGGWSLLLEAARQQAAEARAQHERLVGRRSVRALLALARLATPAYRTARAARRRLRRSPAA